MELLKLMTALRRRRWLMVQAVVFFTLVGAISAVLLPKAYSASARVMVSSSDATSAVLSELGLQEVALGLSGASDEIANHIALATSRPVLEQVIWSLQLRDDDGALLLPDKLLIPGLTGALLAEPLIEVKQQQGTDLVVITATTDDAELSRLMADTVAQVYIVETQERSRQETQDAREFVESRLEVVRDEFDAALADIADAQEAEQILDLDAELRSAISRISELMLAMEETTTRVREIQAQMAEIRGLQGDEGVDFLAPSTVAENADIRTIRESLITLRIQRDAALLEKTERHPDVQRIDAQIRAAETALGLALEEQHQLDPDLLRLQTELAGALERGAELNAAIERTTQRFSVYPDKMRRMAQLELAANAAQDVYGSLQSQVYQIAIAEALSAAPLKLVEPAITPERHLRPKLLVNLLLGAVLGVLVGLGLVAVFEYVDDTVRGPDELREVWDLALLGTIPRHEAGVGRTIAQVAPNDPVSEAFRGLQRGVLFASPDRALRRLVLTSALPGEGKSTVVANLAVALAREGQRVLVVDADLRRPTQHRFHAATNNAQGLTQVLLGQVSAEDAVQATGIEGLSLLSAGAAPPDPGRMVASHSMSALIAGLAERYDRVLIDAPPVMVVDDALALARVADGVALVVESGGTSRRVLTDARRTLDDRGVELLGLVLNKMDYAAAGYGVYEKAYRSYAKGGGA
ncbi:MAG: polysaccharide biosynthesis tyrosine autokinase [Alphaproteobacteria bacterium]|nr:polysaccharide biosynthesis tyrosine autokinase [Alphaproteobacteria bacterium]